MILNMELEDPACDPKSPKRIKYDDIVAASRRIIGVVVKTPCAKANLSEKLGMNLYFKQEFFQYTGSFKDRGVVNVLNMLDEDQKRLGVVTASIGNHGQSMSYFCSKLNIPCIVVMPTSVHLHHIIKAEKYGAKVIISGNNYGEAAYEAMIISRDKKMMFINGFDHPNIIEGQGTIGIEIVEQVQGVDAVIVPCGGGSLLAGIAIALKNLKPDTHVYGVETERTCSMVEALRKNERVTLEYDYTIADSLAIDTVGVNSFNNIRGLVDKMVVVKEDWVARAMMQMVEEEKYVVEGAAAVGVAAILAGLFPNLKGKKVVCLVTGGNVDLMVLSRALERGLAAEGRLLKFKVTIADRPGALAELWRTLTEIGVLIRDCTPERTWVKADVFSVEMKLLCETRGWSHIKELQEVIKKHYKDYLFQDQEDNTRPGRTDGSRRGPCLAPNPVCMQK